MEAYSLLNGGQERIGYNLEEQTLRLLKIHSIYYVLPANDRSITLTNYFNRVIFDLCALGFLIVGQNSLLCEEK